MAKGYKKDDKCLRNELCVLLNFIVSSKDSHQQFIEGGEKSVFASMCAYAVYDEQNEHKPLLTTSEEDLELKKLLWTQVFEVIRGVGTDECIKTALNSEFISSLFLYLDPASCQTAISTSRWYESQLIELQVHALNIIGHLTPFMAERIYQLGGHNVIASFLKTYKDKPRLKACMLCLQAIAPVDFIKQEMASVIETLLAIVAD